MKASRTAIAACLLAAGPLAGVALALNMETVFVGNPANAPDDTCYGSVGYTYRMGKYEVTAGQYTEFLNAVAKTDAYGLSNTGIADGYVGNQILRSGSSGSYTYRVVGNWADHPVNFVSWGDAARFANWMTNGQPTGILTGDPVYDMRLTEDGSYTLYGATTDDALMAVTRRPNARWVIPSENEWYKAAYHKNDGVSGSYFNYPTGSDSFPTPASPPGDSNSANFQGAVGNTTNVGAYSGSASPYGTFDQGGNVFEWNEAGTPGGYVRGLRGGSFDDSPYLLASNSYRAIPTLDSKYVGFRVAEVPEPSTMALLALGGIGMVARRRRPRRAAPAAAPTALIHPRASR